MTTDRIERTGFAPHAGERVHGRHCTILLQLVVAVVMSIAVAASVVTIGIAQADEIGAGADCAIVSGCVLAGMGGFIGVITRQFERVLPS